MREMTIEENGPMRGHLKVINEIWDFIWERLDNDLPKDLSIFLTLVGRLIDICPDKDKHILKKEFSSLIEYKFGNK